MNTLNLNLIACYNKSNLNKTKIKWTLGQDHETPPWNAADWESPSGIPHWRSKSDVRQGEKSGIKKNGYFKLGRLCFSCALLIACFFRLQKNRCLVFCNFLIVNWKMSCCFLHYLIKYFQLMPIFIYNTSSTRAINWS